MGELEEEIVEIDLREYFKIIWKRKKFIIIFFISAVVISFIINSQLTRIYKSSTLVMVKEENSVEDLFEERFSLTSGINKDRITDYTRILKSRRILDKVIDDLELKNKAGELISARELRNKIKISTESNLINITINYSDPTAATKIANKLVSEFKEQNRQLNIAELKGASDFITTQLKNMENKLNNIEDDLLDYKESQQVFMPVTQEKMVMERLKELEIAKTKIEMELNQKQAALKEVKHQFKNQDESIISTKTIGKNPLVEDYKSKLVNLEVELAGLKKEYTNNHPQIVKTENRIKEIKDNLQKMVEEIVVSRTETRNPLYDRLNQKAATLHTEIIVHKVQLNNYQQQIKNIEQELQSLPRKEQKLARIQREQEVAETIYTMLRKKKEEIEIQKAMKTSNIVVIDPAVVNDKPIKPNTRLNLIIAGFLGLFSGIMIVFLLEYLDTKIRKKEEVEEITGLPVVGVIPDIDRLEEQQGK